MSKKWDSDWLVFSKKARRGAFVFLFIFLALVFGRRAWSELYVQQDFSVEYYNLKSNSSDYFQVSEENNYKSFSLKSDKPKFTAPDSLFNPNDYKKENWMKLGLSEKQAASIIKFKESGAVFRTKSDVQKLFVVSEELYALLKDKINLPDSLTKEQRKEVFKNYKPKPMEINSITVKKLQYVRGIGPFYANKIIEYRNMLGGYYSLEQLLEINRFSPDLLDSIKLRCFVDQKEIKKMDLNSVTASDLQGHPYFRVSVARDIVTLRNKLVAFTEVRDILQSELIDEKLFKKISPYLEVKK
jgi:DNA uptake protein ComE-like DNA-binding protein